MTRPQTNIPSRPQPPFPITAKRVAVIAGFGRGSSELGIPTANIPTSALSKELLELEQGVYFGYAKIHRPKSQSQVKESTEKRKDGAEVLYNYGLKLKEEEVDVVFPQVMSIGWNPFYGNKEKAVELHIVHKFEDSFYGAEMSFSVLGYIRPELNYTTKEALIEDINKDIDIGVSMLQTKEYNKYKNDL